MLGSYKAKHGSILKNQVGLHQLGAALPVQGRHPSSTSRAGLSTRLCKVQAGSISSSLGEGYRRHCRHAFTVHLCSEGKSPWEQREV